MLSAAHICSGRSWERWLSVYILIGRHMPCNVCYSGGIQTTKHRDSASHSKEMSWLPSRMFVARQMCLWKTPNSCLIIETFYSDDKSNFGFLENMLSRGLSFIHIPYRLPLGLFLISAMTISLCFTLAGGIWAVKFFKCLDKCYLKVIILSIKTRTCFMIRKPHVFVRSRAFTITCFILLLWSMPTF